MTDEWSIRCVFCGGTEWIGVERWGWYDGVAYWRCAHCGSERMRRGHEDHWAKRCAERGLTADPLPTEAL